MAAPFLWHEQHWLLAWLEKSAGTNDTVLPSANFVISCCFLSPFGCVRCHGQSAESECFFELHLRSCATKLRWFVLCVCFGSSLPLFCIFYTVECITVDSLVSTYISIFYWRSRGSSSYSCRPLYLPLILVLWSLVWALFTWLFVLRNSLTLSKFPHRMSLWEILLGMEPWGSQELSLWRCYQKMVQRPESTHVQWKVSRCLWHGTTLQLLNWMEKMQLLCDVHSSPQSFIFGVGHRVRHCGVHHIGWNSLDTWLPPQGTCTFIALEGQHLLYQHLKTFWLYFSSSSPEYFANSQISVPKRQNM